MIPFNKISLLLFLLLFSAVLNAQPNELSDEDKEAIKYKSKDFIRELGSLLNLIKDPSIETFKRKEIIKNSYSPTSNQIFLDDKVIIEDDIDPSFYDYNAEKNSEVPKYLNDLELFYEKSVEPTIFIENIKTYEVSQRDFIFLPVYFEMTFKGRHIVIDKPYRTVKRIATIKAEKENNLWKPLIVSIVFYNPEQHTFVKEAEDWESAIAQNTKRAYEGFIVAYPESKFIGTAKQKVDEFVKEEETAWQNALEENSIQAFTKFIEAYPDGQNTSFAKQKIAVLLADISRREEEITNEETSTFASYPKVARKGKVNTIKWAQENWVNGAKLELYNGSSLINVLDINNSSGDFLWNVPKNIALGENYKLKLTDVSNEQKSTFSPEFSIKRGFPLGIKILGAGALIGTAVLLLSNGNDNGGGNNVVNPPVGEELPESFPLPGTGG